jgi:hypothetical protein
MERRRTDFEAGMKAETEYTRRILDGIPGRKSLIDMMKEFDNRKSAQISRLVITDNDVYFYLKITPVMQAADDNVLMCQYKKVTSHQFPTNYLLKPAKYTLTLVASSFLCEV